MSYILDALRRSETERNEGKVPDLTQQATLLNLKRQRRARWPLWLGVGVLVLANIGFVSWMMSRQSSNPPADLSGQPEQAPAAMSLQAPAPQVVPEVSVPVVNAPAASVPAVKPAPDPLVQVAPVVPVQPVVKPVPPLSVDQPAWEGTASGDYGTATLAEPLATELAPTESISGEPVTFDPADVAPISDDTPAMAAGIPYLHELDVGFQRRVPDMRFSSHIYSSDPTARRVMVNDIYLREGQRFGQLDVVEITEDGVVFRLGSEMFRMGVVHDWSAPR